MITNWLPEDFLKTIVLFEIPNDKGDFMPHGTGALLNVDQVFVLITCKHVVKNPQTNEEYQNLVVTLNANDGSKTRKNISAVQKEFGLQWFYHKDHDVDLVISPIALEQGKDDFKLLPVDLFEDFEKLRIGEDVFFLGYPLGLGISNVSKLSPLIRSGMVALKNDDKSFLIDANVYGGSSGSPVFYKPTLAKKEGESVSIGQVRGMNFLGLISGNIASIEEAVSRKTGRVRSVFEENSGLGIVYSASLIKDIITSEEFRKILPKTEKAQEAEEKKSKKQETRW